MLNSSERYKLEVVKGSIDRKFTNDVASKLLGISERQLQRLKASVRKYGSAAVVHKLKGRISNNSSKSKRLKVIELVSEKYPDFGPTLASEKLLEIDGILVHPETLRLWMNKAGVWKVRPHRKTKYFSFRERKDYFGEMQQFDGSYHLWFEDRLLDSDGYPVEVCLLASIDDATGIITNAKFDLNEGVLSVFSFWKEYVKKYGKPKKIYLDKYSTYKINHKNAVDNFELLTQFEKAMRLLGVGLIKANTPQAKGRVERLFGTLQDRLIKELRLGKINTIEAGNEFLKEVFLPKHNRKFSVNPAKKGDLHKPLTNKEKKFLDSIFSIKSERVIKNDFTVQFKNHFYQLKQVQPTTIRQKEKITVEEHLNGQIKFVFKQKYLNFFKLKQKPKKTKNNPIIITTHKTHWKPPPNHPWRKYPIKVKNLS